LRCPFHIQAGQRISRYARLRFLKRKALADLICLILCRLAVTSIIRQGRCTLVATTQMFLILGLNALITAYSLSVQYLDGIKFGDYQVTITGILMSICFYCISRAKVREISNITYTQCAYIAPSSQPVQQLSKERPLPSILNLYVLFSILLQFAIHMVSMIYMTNLAKANHE
jgi:cation-transporting ATPase 13A1